VLTLDGLVLANGFPYYVVSDLTVRNKFTEFGSVREWAIPLS